MANRLMIFFAAMIGVLFTAHGFYRADVSPGKIRLSGHHDIPGFVLSNPRYTSILIGSFWLAAAWLYARTYSNKHGENKRNNRERKRNMRRCAAIATGYAPNSAVMRHALCWGVDAPYDLVGTCGHEIKKGDKIGWKHRHLFNWRVHLFGCKPQHSHAICAA